MTDEMPDQAKNLQSCQPAQLRKVLVPLFICMSIFAAFAAPNFVGAGKKAKVSQVKSNMHTLMLAVESYATDMAGQYPRSVYDAFPYFPGGGNSPIGRRGNLPINPFTGNSRDAFCDVRDGSHVPVSLKPGQVGYIYHGSSYSIVGNDDLGAPIKGNAGRTLRLGNE